MNPKFLIGNAFDGSGRKISDLINRFGIDSECCGNNLEIISHKLQKERFNGVIFYMRTSNERTFELLKKISSDYPNLRIYAIMLTESDSVREKLMCAGVRRCFDASHSPIEIYSAIAADDGSEDRIYVPEIVNYLYNKKIPYDQIGFNYLAVGIKKCIDDPTIVRSKMKTTRMYPAIAEACETSTAAVERGLRKIARIVWLKNISFNGIPSLMRLTAGKMVIAAAEEYMNLCDSDDDD